MLTSPLAAIQLHADLGCLRDPVAAARTIEGRQSPFKLGHGSIHAKMNPLEKLPQRAHVRPECPDDLVLFCGLTVSAVSDLSPRRIEGLERGVEHNTQNIVLTEAQFERRGLVVDPLPPEREMIFDPGQLKFL